MNTKTAFIIGCLLSVYTTAWAATCPGKLGELEGDWQRFDKDEFALHYSLNGPHSLRQQADQDANGIPDAVEDAAEQLATLRDILTDRGFRHPLESPRNQRSGAKVIHVVFQELEGKTTGLSYNKPLAYQNQECGLVIRIGKQYSAPNLTPAHEFFHLYQYGYALFKHKWYLEGMARWSETLFNLDKRSKAKLPATEEAQQALFKKSYAAGNTWNALVETCPQTAGSLPGSAPASATLNRKYVSGARVIKQDGSKGAEFIRQVLERFDQLDDQIRKESEDPNFKWSKAAKRDDQYQSLMWEQVWQACGLPNLYKN